MKSGRSIQDVSREILRQQEAKADYPAPSHPLCSTLSASISRSVPMSPLQQKQRIHQDALLLQVPS